MTMQLIEDATLVEKYKSGDAEALNLLVQQHQARAYQMAFRLCRDADSASDIVAEAFFRMCKSITRFEGQCAFTTWFYRIVMNCYVDSLRKGSGRHLVALDDTFGGEDHNLGFEPASPEMGAQTRVEQLEIRDRLNGAIAKLNESQRSIVVMYHCQMLSYEEICEIMGMPLGTVKSKLNRARIALKDLLQADRRALQVA